MAQKPSIPKGTRDFLPKEMMRRNYIFNVIRRIFERYAYVPIETPAMENLSSLLGKYGEEGDKLLFKVLNSGDFTKEIKDITDLNDPKKLSIAICEKGLRYDLTVPFARFVVQHQNDIQFPFKRYQIQPVWRADRPQKGRYREFFQCDVDVIGSPSILNEAELLCIINDVYKALNIRVVTKINNRKILAGIAEMLGYPEKMVDITVAIDKLDKIGLEKVNEELLSKGLTIEATKKLEPILLMTGSFEEKTAVLKDVLKNSETAQKGITEIEELFGYAKAFKVDMPYELDLTLARGLNYYTGAIFEVKALDVAMGSICGGGRYDDLTGIFGLKNVSGVGVSFGADRIYDVMTELDLFPKESTTACQILFVNFGNKEAIYSIPIIQKLRDAGIACMLYPEQAKMQKQFGYADANQIPLVVIIGESEMQNQMVTLKNMESGEQKTLAVEELISSFKIN